MNETSNIEICLQRKIWLEAEYVGAMIKVTTDFWRPPQE